MRRSTPLTPHALTLPAFPPLPDARAARCADDRGLVALIVGGVATGVLGLAVLAQLALTGGLPGSDVDVTGSLTVADAACAGVSRIHGDVHAGAAVTVRDAKGAVVAVGELGSGRDRGADDCVFPITVPEVPGGSPYYDITVAEQGMTTSTLDELRDGLWLQLG